MSILIMGAYSGCALYQMQMTFGANAEPGVPAVMKWFRYRIEVQDVSIKVGTYFKVMYIHRNMVKCWMDILCHGSV